MTKHLVSTLDVFRFIREHDADKGYAPTMRDIAAHFGFRSVASAVHHVKRLQQMGYITIVPGRARTIVVK